MFHLVSTFLQDIRFALRQLRRSPGFALTAILTVALGIGANTAIFTIAHAILLRQLPVPAPQQLYRIGKGDDCCIDGGTPQNQEYSDFSTEAYRVLRDGLPEFEQLAATQSGMGNGPSLAKRAGTNEAAKKVRGVYVSGNYFDTLQVAPAVGRMLQPGDDREGAAPAAVMSYALWQNQYNGDPSILGSAFLLDTHPVTIVGIAAQGFYGDRVQDRPPEFYLPMSLESGYSPISASKNAGLRWLYLIGRVKAGVSLPLLQGKTDNLLRSYLATRSDYKKPEAARELPKVHAEIVSAASGIRQTFQNEAAQGIHILMWIAGLVLLIACANIANLLLARGMARRAETSIRVALGAARRRVLRQTLTESVLLSLLGGAFGLLLAYAGTRAMLSLAFPEAHDVPVNASPSAMVLLFTFAVALLTGLLFGLLPAWATLRSEPADALRGLNRSSQGGGTLAQRAFLVLQAMLSLVLITVAVLLSRSLANLQHQNFGMETANRVVVHLDPQASGYTQDRYEGLMRGLDERLREIPGTTGVAFANYSPLEGNNWGQGVFVEGRPEPTLHDDVSSSWDRVSPGFFQTVQEPFVRGRDFQLTDRSNTPQVVVVNQAFVRKFFSHEDPVGKRFGTELHKYTFTIVGVVADAKFRTADEAPRAMYFRSMLQADPNADPKDLGEVYSLSPHAVLLRTAGVDAGYEQQVRRAFQQVDANLAISDYRSMDSQVAGMLNQERMVARLTAAFGLLALVLASVGLYGVTSYAVTQRVPEIGLRMALGSDRGMALRMILKQAMLQTLIGLAVGVPVALLAGRALKSQLFGVGMYDPVTLLGASAALIVAALLASILPAHRASTIDPMRALRTE